MAKRETFYVRGAVFDKGLSAHAIAVYAYLSYCANREGQCYPGVMAIARACGVGRTTVIKALDALEEAGLVGTRARFGVSRRGLRPRKSNLYSLTPAGQTGKLAQGAPDMEDQDEGDAAFDMDQDPVPLADEPPASHERPPLQQADRPRPFDGGEPVSLADGPRPSGERQIYDNSNGTIATSTIRHSFSPERERTEWERGELEGLVTRLHLDLFFDRLFAQSVEHAVRRMYWAERLKVNQQTLSREEVRGALRLLTTDHIDYVESQLHNSTGSVARGEAFLMACLYNAPFDCMAKSRCEDPYPRQCL